MNNKVDWPAEAGRSVWVAQWDVSEAHSDSGISLHATKEGAIYAVIRELDSDEISAARRALATEGTWYDREDDPRVCLYVYKEIVNP